MKIDIILSNPADKVDLPKIEEYKPKFYTSDEVETLLNEVIGTKLEILVMIYCFYGFRRSEVIGLKKKNRKKIKNYLEIVTIKNT